MPALDRYLPDFDVNEVHAIELAVSSEKAVERILRLPAGSDPLVRLLFKLRRIPGADLSMERFADEILRFQMVERSATTAVAVGRALGLQMGIAFEAEPAAQHGSRLITETRVANAGLAFRLQEALAHPPATARQPPLARRRAPSRETA